MNGRDVVILSGVRTPIGSFLGSLKDVRVQTLGARVIEEAIRRSGIQISQIDEVVMGNNAPTDSRSNIAREAMLETDLPWEIPAFTVGKACASGLKSVAVGATIIRAGEADVVVVGEMCHWCDVRFMQDNNVPIIMTDHAASENPGMRSLAKLVERELRIPTHFIEVGCPLRTIV